MVNIIDSLSAKAAQSTTLHRSTYCKLIAAWPTTRGRMRLNRRTPPDLQRIAHDNEGGRNSLSRKLARCGTHLVIRRKRSTPCLAGNTTRLEVSLQSRDGGMRSALRLSRRMGVLRSTRQAAAEIRSWSELAQVVLWAACASF